MKMADDSLELAAFVSQMGGERALRVEESFGHGYVRLLVPEAERRQAQHDIRCIEDVVIELLRNARDAQARRIYVATTREGNLRTLTMLDDGCGIPADMHEHVFEARVTSKLDAMRMDRWGVHGRGMALFSVRENAREAAVLSSGEGLGCAIRVLSDASSLKERKDQSTWPHLGTNDDGEKACKRGPHNIIRTCCEFALEERGSCEVYLGSPAEIVATARARSSHALSFDEELLIDNLCSLPVCERLSFAVDARELAEAARSLGLDISERTAHRIVAGEIRPLKSVLTLLEKGTPKEAHAHGIDLERDRRGLRIDEDDVKRFVERLERDFEELGDAYYLQLLAAPRVRVTPGKIVVTFDVQES